VWDTTAGNGISTTDISNGLTDRHPEVEPPTETVSIFSIVHCHTPPEKPMLDVAVGRRRDIRAIGTTAVSVRRGHTEIFSN
jgi:hypothetical protein